MATLKKKSVYSLSSLFSFSSVDLSTDQRRNSQPDGSHPVSQAAPPPPPAVNTNQPDMPTVNHHQRAVSAQLRPDSAHIARKAVSTENLNGMRPSSGTTRSRPTTPNTLKPPGFRVSPRASPSALPRSSAPSSPTGGEPLSQHAQSLPTHLAPSPIASPNQKVKRKGWFGGGGKLHKHREAPAPKAWIAGEGYDKPYTLDPLLTAQMVPELWNPSGDTFVYLFPRTSGKGPSFRVDSSIFSSSAALTKLAFGNLYSVPTALQSNVAVAQEAQRRIVSEGGRPTSMVVPGTPPSGSATASYTDGSEDSQESRGLSDVPDAGPIHLYVPMRLSTDGVITAAKGQTPQLDNEDLEVLVQARNLFAFLLGQSLVATEARSTFYDVFLGISDLLRGFAFTNLDGSTYGEVAHASFEAYVEELQLSDVRSSDEKTIDMLVLSERMKSVTLFNEAFVHTVGKWEDLQGHQKLELISPMTINRLEKASMDLNGRKMNVKAKLEDFDFPGLFAGTWISNTAEEAKAVSFPNWRKSFNSTKNWFRGYYKHKYGAWPPKARSKKNEFEVSGLLNRLVLKDLYHDLSNLYDLLADRTALTTRSQDFDLPEDDSTDPMIRALRRVLGEYDRSTPPVQPPIPFDTPIKPKLIPEPQGGAHEINKAYSKKLKKDELHRVLKATYNEDAAIKSPFIDNYLEYDLKQMDGSTISQMADIRFGQWVFIYAVLQSLPMLVVDAPGIKWTQKVEYFLCIPPRQGVPWAREGPSVNRSWYGVAGSDKVVYLPSDLIQYGVEGIFRRSHCWQMATKWTEHSSILTAATGETFDTPLPPPPNATAMLTPPEPRSRSQSPPGSGAHSKRASMVMLSNLEALPVPAGVAPPGAESPQMRTVSATDPSKTFDSILSAMSQGQGKKKKK